MISTKYFQALDGDSRTFLSDFIIKSEQYCRVYLYKYNPSGVDGDVDPATGLYIRVLNTPVSADMVDISEWALVNNTIAFYSNPPEGATLVLEVASNSEDLGDIVSGSAVQAAEAFANASETSSIASAASATASAASATASATSATESAASATASDSSATASATSATESATSATASAASETASAASATNSANSATASATSATNSEASYQNVLAYDILSEGYKDTALAASTLATTKASEASTSATNAATSETNAATSASTASTQATNSANSATASATSATNSANSATASANSASAASTSESNASSSASTATTQAGIATAQAGIATSEASDAATSASTATTQAGIATTQATNAASSATAAQASLDEFQGQYHGALATAPTVGVDAGDLYFDTAIEEMMVYSGTEWKKAGSTVNGTSKRQTYTATSGQTAFSVTGGYDAGFADVYLNGVKLVNGVDVDISSGTGFTLTAGATVGDNVDFIGYGAFEVADTYTQAEIDNTYGSEGRTQSATDTTEGRLLKVGDFGVGTGVRNWQAVVSSATNNLYWWKLCEIDSTEHSERHALHLSGARGYGAGQDISSNGATIYLTSANQGSPDNLNASVYNASSTFRLIHGCVVTYDGWKGTVWVQLADFAGVNVLSQSNSIVNQYTNIGQLDKPVGAYDKAVYDNYHTGNILGTVSQSGGVPTGAIIESGSNANGYYTKFADGTMICTAASSLVSGNGTLLYRAVAFPAFFSNLPNVSTTWQIANGPHFDSTYQGIGTTSVTAIIAPATGVSGYVIVQAIGRWF